MDISLYRTEVQNWIRTVYENRGVDTETTIKCCNELEEYGRKIKDDGLIGFACFSRGEAYYLTNEMREFYREMISCLPPLERAGEWGLVAQANNMLGIMSLNRGNAPFAMDYYIKAISICHQHHLLDFEWVVHMNIATLYLNIEEYQKAIHHANRGFEYLRGHEDMPGYAESLTVVYLDIAKAYLCIGEIGKAEEYLRKLKNECLEQIQETSKLPVYCLLARFCNLSHDEVHRDEMIQKIDEIGCHEVAIMDTFDDFYDYLNMLLEISRYKEFEHLLDEVEEITKKTTVKYLEQKLLTLRLLYYRKMERNDLYQKDAVHFFELSELLERENRMMITSMIMMRNSLNDLALINKEVERENQVLHRRSETDALTGMNNRFKLNDYADDAFENAYRKKTPLAVEILDIDYFKQYNDNYGHQAGDRCIKEVADIIKSLKAYGGIFCARYGGDEFVIVYEGYTEHEVLDMAAELKRRVEEKAINHAYSLVADQVTISQGICWGVPDDVARLFDYLHQADLMLYRVKEESRNGIRLGYINEETVLKEENNE